MERLRLSQLRLTMGWRRFVQFLRAAGCMIACTACSASTGVDDTPRIPWDRVTTSFAFTRGDTLWLADAATRAVRMVVAIPGGGNLGGGMVGGIWLTAWSRDGSRITYTTADGLLQGDAGFADRVEHVEIATGTRIAGPGSYTTSACCAAWSSDGRLAHNAFAWPAGSSLRVGSDTLGPIAHRARPAWSPDATRIIVAVTQRDPATGAERQVLTRVAVATRVRQALYDVGGETGSLLDPAFSPDGSLIYFSRPTQAANVAGLWVMDADGTAPRRIIGDPDASHPEPSPDGREVLFLRAGLLHIMNADGNNVAAIGRVSGPAIWRPN